MSKFNFKKPNWSKIGLWCADVFRNNSSTIVGGMSMIGLALLCRKFDIPYTVLTDPYYSAPKVKTTSSSSSQQQIMWIPSDSVEASIQAIYDGTTNMYSDYNKESAAKEILSIISARKDDISEATRSYAIAYLRMIADSMYSDYHRDNIMKMISKIAKNDI